MLSGQGAHGQCLPPCGGSNPDGGDYQGTDRGSTWRFLGIRSAGAPKARFARGRLPVMVFIHSGGNVRVISV
jgi:hypothetical protein